MARLSHAMNMPVRGRGPRPEKQTLVLAEVEQRRAELLAQPPSAARSAALKTTREQLKSIRNRVGDGQ